MKICIRQEIHNSTVMLGLFSSELHLDNAQACSALWRILVVLFKGVQNQELNNEQCQNHWWPQRSKGPRSFRGQKIL